MTDIADCWDRGFAFEDRVIHTFRGMGYSANKSSEAEDMRQHIDLWAEGVDGKWHSFDAKAMRSLSRGGPLQDLWVAIEWRGVGGGPGSIYGSQEFFVFERAHGLTIVPRAALLEFGLARVDRTAFVHRSDYALYKLYTRKGRKDLISWVSLDDMPPSMKKDIPAARPTVPCI